MTYYDKCHAAEIDLRGRFIAMACDMEFTLMQIMVNLAPDPHNHFRCFNEMMMHAKIQNTIADVKRFRPHLYTKYEVDLESLWEFKRIRNDLCHHRIDWGQNSDFQSFNVMYVEIDENNVERLAYKKYTLGYLIESNKKFNPLNITLLKLLNEIRAGV